jgi:hypothetical protein
MCFVAPIQAAFFGPHTTLAAYKGLQWLGVCVLAVAQLVNLMYFPMWGGMLCPARKGYTEHDYYTAEYTQAEIDAEQHVNSFKFVSPILKPRRANPPLLHVLFWAILLAAQLFNNVPSLLVGVASGPYSNHPQPLPINFFPYWMGGV